MNPLRQPNTKWNIRRCSLSHCIFIPVYLLVLVMVQGCIDPCDYHECLNDGVCDDWECLCSEGWMGEDCSIPLCEPVEFNGHSYETVGIGSQCWFSENLRTTEYANGDAIPGGLGIVNWSNTNLGAQSIPSNSQENLELYGRLYNWHAVKDSRGLCPAGWHVPTDEEWMQLEMELGLTYTEAHSEGDRGWSAGKPLKSSATDSPPWDGSNSTGFSGLPGGLRAFDGTFWAIGGSGLWWSSSSCADDTKAWFRRLESNHRFIVRTSYYQRSGMSVRCIRD